MPYNDSIRRSDLRYNDNRYTLKDNELLVNCSNEIEINPDDAFIFRIVLFGNASINILTNHTLRMKIVIKLIQDSVGGRTITWGNYVRFSDDMEEPTLSTEASKMDYLGFMFDNQDSKWDLVGLVRGF